MKSRVKKIKANEIVEDSGVEGEGERGGEKKDVPKKERKVRNSSKKTPPVVAFVSPSGIIGSFLGEQRPLIAHLPVSTASVNFEASNVLRYDPNVISMPAENTVPKPYDIGTDELSYLDGIIEGTGVESDIVIEKSEEESCVNRMDTIDPSKENGKPRIAESICKLPSHYSEKLMVLFQDSNRYQRLPEKTEIACFWCCHSFQNQPFALPSHILEELWYMYGNFCSAECATAYLFKERIDNHVQWERFALLNSLYNGTTEAKSVGIRPAPPREVLRMFGGSMDISEFRAVMRDKKLRIDVMTPPMVSIIQTMDTKPIDFYDQNLKNVFTHSDIQHKYNAPGAQGLRLRRSKPVKSREATVEWAMQIQQIQAGV